MKDQIPGGYIMLARKTLDSGIMKKPPLYLKIWTWMLLKATRNQYGDLEPGQFRASIADIQDATSYYVGYRKVRPTEKEVRRALDWLRCPHEREAKGAMIGATKGARKMLITIYNYEYYQSPKNYEGRNEGRNEKSTNGEVGAHEEQEVLQEDIQEKEKTKTCPEQNSGQEFRVPTKDGGVHVVTNEMIERYELLYPDVDVRLEVQKSIKWCEDNPRKLKVFVDKFLTGWMNRAQVRAEENMTTQQRRKREIEREFILSCEDSQ